MVANKQWNASNALYHKMKMLTHQNIVKFQICKIMHIIHNGKLLNNYTMSNIEAVHRYETRSNLNINYHQISITISNKIFKYFNQKYVLSKQNFCNKISTIPLSSYAQRKCNFEKQVLGKTASISLWVKSQNTGIRITCISQCDKVGDLMNI